MNRIPDSDVPVRVGLVGLVGASAAFLLTLQLQLPSMAAIILLLAACAVPMWWLEAKRHATANPDYDASRAATSDLRRQRLLGVVGVLTCFAVSILMQLALAPGWVSGFHAWTLPALPFIALWTLSQLRRPAGRTNSTEKLGAVLANALQSRRIDSDGRQIILGWLVKAFFLPLMLAWSYTWLAQASEQFTFDTSWMSIFIAAMAWLYAVDTAFATIGYMSTDERIGAQIRSVDTTPLGWLSALVCYPPLSLLVLRQWLEYKDGLEWQAWLQTPWISIAWGAAILLLTAIYTWASVAFGPRFSNLTHRGIITSGPYRYTKHPAYICKNLSWWLISVPFVSTAGTWAAVLNCLALLGVNAIYWLRARTEERHLMRDETYQQYAAWIAQHGLIGRVRRLSTGRVLSNER